MSIDVTQTVQPSSTPVTGRSKPAVGMFRLRYIVNTAIAAVLALLFLWPFFSMVGWSFNRIDVYMNPMWPIPASFTTVLYELMWTRYGFQRYVLNSVTVVTAMTVLSTLASALAGYALAK